MAKEMGLNEMLDLENYARTLWSEKIEVQHHQRKFLESLGYISPQYVTIWRSKNIDGGLYE